MELNTKYSTPFSFFILFIFIVYLLVVPGVGLCSNKKYLNTSQQSNFIVRGRFIYNRPKTIPLFGINYSYIKKSKKRLFFNHGKIEVLSFFLPQNFPLIKSKDNKYISFIPIELQKIYHNPFLRNPLSIWFEEYVDGIVKDTYKFLEKEGKYTTGIDKNNGRIRLKMEYSQRTSPLIYDKSIDMSLLTVSGIIERKIILILEKIRTISTFKLSIFDEDRSGKQYYGLFFSKPSPFLQSKITGKLLLRKYDEEINNDLNEKYWSIGEIGINWHNGLPFFNKFEKFSFPLTATIDGNVIIPDTSYTIFPGLGMELEPTFNFSIRNKLSFKMNFYVNANKFINYHARINHAIAF